MPLTETQKKRWNTLLVKDTLTPRQLAEFKKLDAIMYPTPNVKLTLETGFIIAAFTKSDADQALMRAITDELGKYGIPWLIRLVRPMMPRRRSKSEGYLPEMLHVRSVDVTMATSIYERMAKRLARKAKHAS